MNARWTNREIALLRLIFAVSEAAELCAALPDHPLSSIRSTAYALGLSKRRGQARWATLARRHIPVFDFSAAATPLQAAE